MANFMKTGGIQSMLKEGHRVFDDPVMKNIDACRELTKITRTSLGPDGLSKLVVNHLDKVFVSHDAHTIMSEMEVQHPAAKLLVLAATAMNDEVGDGTNLVLTFAGELLSQAEGLITKGLHTSDIITGYTAALKTALEALPSVVVMKLTDIRDRTLVQAAIRTAIMSKAPAFHQHLSTLVADACINSLPSDSARFCVDDVRTVKMEGMSVSSSEVVHGFLVARDAEGITKKKMNAKVAVFQCVVDAPACETKGVAVVDSAEALKKLSKTEEEWMERNVKGFVDAGVDVVVSSQAFGDLALHYLARYEIMAVRIMSRHDLRRLASAVGAQQLSSLVVPQPEDLGACDEVAVEEYAGRKMTVFRQRAQHSQISTILLRGPTSATLDDAERAVHDGINAFRALARHPELCAGGGAVEFELSERVRAVAASTPGLEQYAFGRFADAFHVVLRTLADVSGVDSGAVVDTVKARKAAGAAHPGFSVFAAGGAQAVDDVTAGPEPLLDLLVAKEWALRLAVDAVVNVLRTDQIIMAKQAGGPRMQTQRDED
eukprot:TRINITY_DN68136_c0_g1_i1.p1 TRINITY_DN68136_c0_g1~~TRINITY_DN68136_c0_g1_i1.p1  ORF type:complete len:544 (-),score=188.44 TRINITY_DN68136_c0_g1_i1:114-1745(-)